MMETITKIKAIKIFLFAFFLLAAGITNAQIGIGIATPAPSAQLDVSSTTKGFLPPRMTETQRNAIISPDAGLIIWCSNCGESGELQVFNGTKWTNIIGGVASAPKTNSVKIGTQVWMQKNLDVSTYRNGDTIPQVTDPSEWESSAGGAWCYYNNDPANGPIYGKLYNWFAMRDPRGLAPLGWHIPDNDDWRVLTFYLGGDSLAGDKMRDTSFWNIPNSTANNESGFTGRPGGQRTPSFNSLGSYAYWWSASYSVTPSPSHNLFTNYFELGKMFTHRSRAFGETIGYSVRCIKDAEPEPIPTSVTIGTQVWTTKNLDVATYRNGDTIPQVTDSRQWDTLTTGAWRSGKDVYGKFYNWFAVNDARGLAPEGFHIPSDEEWNKLSTFLGGDLVAGGKMKTITNWEYPNTGATNESGFWALPGGIIKILTIFDHEVGPYQGEGRTGFWWSSTEDIAENVWYRSLSYSGANLSMYSCLKGYGLSVRCVKN